MGSLYLVLPGPLAGWLMRGLVWLSILLVPIVMTTSVDLAAVDPKLLTGAGFPAYVRLLTPPFNIFGTFGLVGVAGWSAWRFGRAGGVGDRSEIRRRFWSATMIAIGALATASGATLLRFGVPGGFYVSQLGGIVLMWVGFSIPARGR
jgi:hypothetical protein